MTAGASVDAVSIKDIKMSPALNFYEGLDDIKEVETIKAELAKKIQSLLHIFIGTSILELLIESAIVLLIVNIKLLT